MARNQNRRVIFACRLAAAVGLASVIACSRVHSRAEKSVVITVGHENANVIGDDDSAIQKAVDRATAAGGGTVTIKAGNYILRNSVRLASHIALQGEGAQKTILKKAPDVRSRLKLDADSSEFQASVEDAKGFTPGMGVIIFDKFSFQGLFPNLKTIKRIDGSTLFFDDYVNFDYMVLRMAGVSNCFPLLLGIGVEDVSIRDLTADGNRSGRETYAERATIAGGAVYFYHSKTLSIQNIVARNVAGDGISTQFVEDPLIEHCDVHGNAGLGIHLGTGALRAIVRRNRSHNNGDDGLYLCWNVQHGTFEENECWANGRDGISIGHRDTNNTFIKNVSHDNVRAGIELRDEGMNAANYNTFRENVIQDNGRPGAPGYGVLIEGATQHITLVSNTIRETRPAQRAAQRVAIHIGPQADFIICQGNVIGGNLKRPVVDESKGKHNKLAQLTKGSPLNP
jgi:parallel beta helix pectate lyase-like protein